MLRRERARLHSAGRRRRLWSPMTAKRSTARSNSPSGSRSRLVATGKLYRALAVSPASELAPTPLAARSRDRRASPVGRGSMSPAQPRARARRCPLGKCVRQFDPARRHHRLDQSRHIPSHRDRGEQRSPNEPELRFGKSLRSRVSFVFHVTPSDLTANRRRDHAGAMHPKEAAIRACVDLSPEAEADINSAWPR